MFSTSSAHYISPFHAISLLISYFTSPSWTCHLCVLGCSSRSPAHGGGHVQRQTVATAVCHTSPDPEPRLCLHFRSAIRATDACGHLPSHPLLLLLRACHSHEMRQGRLQVHRQIRPTLCPSLVPTSSRLTSTTSTTWCHAFSQPSLPTAPRAAAPNHLTASRSLRPSPSPPVQVALFFIAVNCSSQLSSFCAFTFLS